MRTAAALSRVPRLPDVPRLTELAPVSDLRAAGWIVAALTDFGKSVVSIVPRGFDAYVRIFHPAYRMVGREAVPVRWSEIAAANGKKAHAGMQLGTITGDVRFEEHPQPGVFDGHPLEGHAPRALLELIVPVLGRHTTTPDRCWFAVWHGFGGLRPELRYRPTFATPGREYFLLSGPIGGVFEDLSDFPRPESPGPWWPHLSPNLWWPDDRAWCVATEIDLKTTYVGCSSACGDDLLALPGLEAFEIDPSHGIGWASDDLNAL